jgi:hypothetical protein
MECRWVAGKESVVALEPFRFVHASHLRLDAPLVGLETPDDDARRLAEDATLLAFRRVVQHCQEHHVEFLLLTGSIWCESLTPRAWRTLAAGCDALSEADIRVIWAGDCPEGNDDIRPMLAGLLNFTLLSESDPDPVAVVREGRVVASVSTSDPRITAHQSETSADVTPVAATSIQIRVVPRLGPTVSAPAIGRVPDVAADAGLAPLLESAARAGINYLTLGEGSQRQSCAFEGGWLHQPGPPQGLVPGESGPHGCSLIAVDTAGACHMTFLPTAAVRWESFRVAVERGMSRSQLIHHMQQMALDRENLPGQQLVCFRWQLVGSGPLFDSLATADATADLSADIDDGLPSCADLTRRQLFELRPHMGADDDPIVRDYLTLLSETNAADPGELVGAFADDEAPLWSREVIRSLQCQEDRAVLDTAIRLGHDWLQNHRRSER